MNAMELLEEYRQAQEEHARALAAVKEMQEKLEKAKTEYTEARATEMLSEREIERATEQMLAGLEELHVASVPPRVSQWLVEYHANIGCYHCYLQVEGEAYDAVDGSTLAISVEFPRVEVKSTNDQSSWWTVEIEQNVDVDNLLIGKSDHVYVRLPVRESDKAPVDGFSSFSQTTSDELVVENYGRVTCRGCEVVLMEASPTRHMEKVLPLPSANWMEMFDFWGSGLGSFEHIPREGIFAQERRVFVGESHVLLHANDLQDGAIADSTKDKTNASTPHDSEDAEPEWLDISCAKCRKVIGMRSRENPATLRLEKHLISSNSHGTETSSRDIFERYTIDSAICASMLHTAESDGVFRFALQPTDAASTLFHGVFVQLLGWDTMLQSTGRTGFQRVLKIVYRVEDSKVQSSSATSQTDLPAILRIHGLQLAPELGSEIVARLQHSTTLLPPSQRVFNRMAVGYLYT
ncbi:hypothetical protein Poli38472_001455 [Pythium oligandrum]|uniref:Uncharacterized protein n=1 Tax=Pythium oligandrum TaxID=41045 RepID=A0A8K1FQD2_PYTOL|nr:hypothetical protein Poli38472_001455 [Pythium oligandrum]|eukprot:TMW69299.1 hypothetical protein Poli38472_001455 [Pythium oligandrum]